MNNLFDLYKECSLKYYFVYPRYISNCHPREITSEDVNFDGKYVYPEDYEFVNRTDELWYQKSKLKNGMIISDNDLIIKKISNNTEVINYISDTETYFNPVKNEKTYYLNNLIDDPAALTKRSCGYWIGNTNTSERYQVMKPVTIDNVEYTVTIKRIWGFEPDLAESYDDISNGIINGFSKKKYTLFMTHDDINNMDVYIPTVKNKLLTSEMIKTIIESHEIDGEIHYPNYETDKYVLFVSD